MTDSREANDTGKADILMLTTTYASLAQRSGYSLLAQYVPGAVVLTAERKTATAFTERAFRFALSRAAVTDWYQLASAALEWRAWRKLREGFRGVVHVLWADSDLGVLDLLCDPKHQHLCCTFHQCPDTLRQVVRDPGRLRRIQKFILMSNSQKDYFLSAGIEQSRLHVIPHGIDTAYFRPDPLVSKNAFTVLSVGDYRRDFSVLKGICARLAGEPRIRFEIVTNPRHHQIFEGLPNVHCRSRLSDEELLAAYRSASCYLFSAQDSTANNALLEAMACGLPVVAENVGGVPDYVNDRCAFRFSRQDTSQAAGMIEAMRENDSMRRSMSNAARERALELDWERIAGTTNQLYRTMMQ